MTVIFRSLLPSVKPMEGGSEIAQGTRDSKNSKVDTVTESNFLGGSAIKPVLLVYVDTTSPPLLLWLQQLLGVPSFHSCDREGTASKWLAVSSKIPPKLPNAF